MFRVTTQIACGLLRVPLAPRLFRSVLVSQLTSLDHLCTWPVLLSADDIEDFGAAVDVVLGDPLLLSCQPVVVICVPRNPALVSHSRRHSGTAVTNVPHQVEAVRTFLQGDRHFRGSQLHCLEECEERLAGIADHVQHGRLIRFFVACLEVHVVVVEGPALEPHKLALCSSAEVADVGNECPVDNLRVYGARYFDAILPEHFEVGGNVRLQLEDLDIVNQTDEFIWQVGGVINEDDIAFEVGQNEKNVPGLALSIDGEQPVFLDI